MMADGVMDRPVIQPSSVRTIIDKKRAQYYTYNLISAEREHIEHIEYIANSDCRARKLFKGYRCHRCMPRKHTFERDAIPPVVTLLFCIANSQCKLRLGRGSKELYVKPPYAFGILNVIESTSSHNEQLARDMCSKFSTV